MLGVALLLAAILTPNFIKARAQGRLTSCKSNLKNAATALEMYSTDNKGFYPKKLAHLTPNYLKVIPNCSSAQGDTYSRTYRVANNPHAFTLFCRGNWHENNGWPPNYPIYSSYLGLIER